MKATCAPLNTLVLADAPRAGDWLLGGQEWRRVELAALPPADRELWARLAGQGEAWTTRGPAWPGWRTLVVIDRAEGSQYDLLQDAGEETVGGGAVACLALSGRDFHGQRGRSWQALRGNLHLSAALHVGAPAARLGPGLSMLPAVAARDAVVQASGGAITPGFKWVNDLLIDGAKVAGVLTSTSVQGSTMTTTVLGVGLNLERAPALPPSPFVPRATCLAHHAGAAPIQPRPLLDGLLCAITRRLGVLLEDGPGELLDTYRRHSVVLGRRVKIWNEGSAPPDPPAREGVVEAIADDLSLCLRGDPEPVTRGRLALVSR